MQNKKQHGGALMVALVLIFMMSIMGISSMRSATLEKRMATNSVHKSTALQAAESATELAIGKTSNLTNALNSGGTPVNATVSLNNNTALTLNATVQYTGMGPPIGFGLGADSGFVAFRYQAKGTSKLNGVNAAAEVIQGAYIIAPSPKI
ncbi:MAG: hypothetical protein KTR32_29370 [Granulosicoccus sp.]|nr:hypothetical protein [Granulosicoccus sp.]